MRWPLTFPFAAIALAMLVSTADVRGREADGCTITVNSADEKETFRRYLPESKYRFVELVERGRPDWLALACRAGVSCDVLVISGHYDGGTDFFRTSWRPANSCPSMNWSACLAAAPARGCFPV